MNIKNLYSQKDLDLSCIIITFNEQDNIEQCLNSLPKGAEVIVVDSFSTDSTCEICANFNAKIYKNTFINYAQQKNVALKYATKNWVLSIDADEVLSPDLKEFLETQRYLEIVDKVPHIEGFFIKRRLVFLGKLMLFGKTCDYPIRLFKKKYDLFVGDVHEKINIPSKHLKYLNCGCIYHYSYKNLEDYFNKFNLYTTKYAISVVNKNTYNSKKTNFVKKYTFILRPYISFVIRYILRLGFLDGYAGYCYAMLSSFYDFVKYAKVYELSKISSASKTFKNFEG